MVSLENSTMPIHKSGPSVLKDYFGLTINDPWLMVGIVILFIITLRVTHYLIFVIQLYGIRKLLSQKH